MDVDMPGLDGLTVAQHLQSDGVPSHVIALTGLTPGQVTSRYPEADTPMIYKHRQDDVDWNVKLLNSIRNFGVRDGPIKASSSVMPPPPFVTPREQQAKAILIGASTGGPQAVATVLKALPDPLPLPVLMVIHVAASFDKPMAEWLAQASGKAVRMARDGEVVADAAGQCLLAPVGVHMTVSGGRIVLRKGSPIHSVCPAVDPLFDSAADDYDGQVVAALLTGMGRDGANGLLTLHQRGAFTIAQDKATSAVFGMPAQAIVLGAARLVLPLPQIAATIRLHIQAGKADSPPGYP